MKTLDHDTFHAMEIDALYEELDGPSSAAIREHADSCESCASRFDRLRRARQRGLSVLAEAVPHDFESRVMAAVDAALAKRTAGPGQSSTAPQARAPAGASAKVIPFFARPSFAVAATLILVLGAAAILSQMGMSKTPMAASESAPAVAAAPTAVAAASRADQPNDPSPPPPSVPSVVAIAEPPAVGATKAPEENAAKPKIATLDPDLSPRVQGAAGPAPLAAAPSPPSKPALRPATGGGQGHTDPAFAAALALYNSGKYAEALPRFEALKGKNPEADLYAARSLQRTSGCSAAAPRFDATAQRNRGTVVGSRAQIEGGACYQAMNDAPAARSRYQAAKDEGVLASEAKNHLDALDGKNAAPAAPPAATTTTPPGTPGGGRPATPKAPINELDNSLK